MASVVVIMDRPAVDVFRGWEGPVGRAVSKLVEGAALAQKFLAPKKTGKLFQAIKVGQKGHWARGIEVGVGANPDGVERGYALYTDQGTIPHVIRPHNPRGFLVFFWPKVGHVVHLRSVSHPGNRAWHWAEGGMDAAMSSWSSLYVPGGYPSAEVAIPD